MHASTRILLLVLTAAAIAVDGRRADGHPYADRSGFGYNRLTWRRGRDGPPESTDATTALAELSDLRERGLISPDEYLAKRAKIVERL